MPEPTLQQSVDQFKEDQERVRKFVNEEGGYLAEDGTPVKSLRDFNVTLAGYEGQALVFRNETEVLKNQASDSAADSLQSKLESQAAAEGSGDVLFYNTYALANAALAGLPEGQVVEVFVDETKGSQRTRYRKESGVYVLKLIFETVFVDSRTDLKGLDTAFVTSAYLTEAGRAGYFKWDATVLSTRARADANELDFVSPNLAVNGAWVRQTLTDNDKLAINKGVNERPFEFRGEPVDVFNTVTPVEPSFGKQINICSESESAGAVKYAKDSGISAVGGDFINYRGIQLQRVTGTTNFSASLRDIRAADYGMVPGRRYIASAYVCAPFVQGDNNSTNRGFWNRFMWMWSPTNNTSFGHGAKLIGPIPRRVWIVVEAASATAFRVVSNPSVSLSLSSSSNDALRWFFNGSALIGTAQKDIYIGGFQLEEAPNQTEKTGIAMIGTSIDSSTSSLQHWTTERFWPRFLEGLLSVPIFNGAIGGQNSTQLEARFDTDISPWGVNAKYCILAANVNDFSEAGPFNSALYRSNWLSMYNKAIAAGMIPIFMTPPRRSSYDAANNAANMEAEIEYIKKTYPFVIDRDFVWQDPFNSNLLNPAYENDGVHAYGGMPELAFMIYAKYRHFFQFDNVPRPYQKTLLPETSIQSYGAPIWAGRYSATRVTSTSITTIRESQSGTAPIIIFDAALTTATTYQLPCANYSKAAERVNTDIQVQQVRNNTTGGFNIRIQYYAKNISDVLVTVGPELGPIPPGETWTLACDGTTAWRVQ